MHAVLDFIILDRHCPSLVTVLHDTLIGVTEMCKLSFAYSMLVCAKCVCVCVYVCVCARMYALRIVSTVVQTQLLLYKYFLLLLLLNKDVFISGMG